MNKDLEYIDCELFFQIIEENFPNRSKRSIAEEARISEDRLYSMKEQKTISLTVADHILTNLDLHHLLSTGDIPIYSKAEERIVFLEKELKSAKHRTRDETRRANEWRRRCKSAESQVRNLQRKLEG